LIGSKKAVDFDKWWKEVQEIREIAKKKRHLYVQKMANRYNRIHNILE
jgi:hypothetical protein